MPGIFSFKRHWLSFTFLAISFITFFGVNHGGNLPVEILDQFGFFPKASQADWIYRTITSDWLYLTPFHFYSCVITLSVLIYLCERFHSHRFLLIFFGLVSFFDDYVNYFLILKPFQFLRPELYHSMITEKDVGSSLILSATVGLLLIQLDRYREFIFVFLSIAFVFGTVFSTSHYSSLVLNLNHFVFLCIGYLTGKIFMLIKRNSKRLHEECER